MLGTLVDRAVCMPFAKPQVLRRGHRRAINEDGKWVTEATTIGEDVTDAVAFIVRSLESPRADRRWSKAEIALDPAGPWWSKTLDDFLALDDRAQDWVLDRLAITAEQAASCLQERAEAREWSWLWSQPSFARPGKLRPLITRPDLVGGLDWRRCDVIDLKTTSKWDLESVLKPDLQKSFDDWGASLRALRFKPQHCLALVVSTEEDDRWEWFEVEPSFGKST